MRMHWTIGLAMLMLAVPAMAQPGGGRGRGEGWRGPGRGPGPGDPAEFLRMLTERITSDLSLSEEQQTAMAEIRQRYEDKLAEQGGRREEMRELAMAYRQARQSGDTEEADRIREEMRTMGGGPRQLMQDLFGEIESILDAGQLEQFNTMREDFIASRQGMGRGQDLRRLAAELPDLLELSDEQRVAYAELLEEFRAEQRGDSESWQQRREIVQQLQEARESGDEARMEELREQLRVGRSGRNDPAAFIERLIPMLTDEQQARLAEIRQDFDRRGRRGGEQDVRTILRAAMRIDLEPEQKDRVREISREAQKTERGRLSREERTQLADSVKTQILELLNAEQKAEFEDALGRLDQAGRRGPAERGQRGQRGGRGQGRAGQQF